MAIVLAIEPDRRQAAHLTAIVRHQVDAELVLADTTEGALDAIGNRVPDLVLVPALLSPQDDAALAAALRVIAAAAHVRTLTIPVLASGTKRAAAAGMLAKWRKTRAASPEPDGCDPAVFGEQISTYLREAAEERAQLADDLLEVGPIVAPAPLKFEPAPVRIEPEPVPFEPELPQQVSALEPEAAAQPAADPEMLWADALEPANDLSGGERIMAPAPVELEPELIEQLWADAAEAAADTPEEPVVDLSEELESLSEDEENDELFDGEPVGVFTIGTEAEEPALDAFDALRPVLDKTMTFEAAETTSVAAAETMAETVAAAAAALVVEPPEQPRADIEPWVPMYLTPGRLWPTLEGMPAEVPVARTEQPDWIELVASLRLDIERRRTEPATAQTHPIAARPSDGGNAEPHPVGKKPRAHASKAQQPVQDEWGFFDPEQCGFSTLLAKLDEITDDGARG